MAKLSNDKLLARYRLRIEAARGYRRYEALPQLWQRMIDLYAGKHYPRNMSKLDLVAVNVSKATIDVMVPSTTVEHPEVTVNARTPEHEEQAWIAQAAVNYEWQHRDFTPETMRTVKEGLICGTSWAKVGWRFVEEEVADEEAYAAALGELQAQVDAYAADNPDMAGSLPTPDELAAQVPKQTKRVVKEDHPFLEQVSVFDVYVDPEATSPRNMKWIAQRVLKPIDEVRANKRYRQSARLKVEADSRHPDEWYMTDDWKKQDDCKRVAVWEFYDLILGTMCVFTEGGDGGFLVEPTAQPYAFGHPFVPFIDYDVPGRFYGMGELEAVEPLQMELNQTRTGMFNDRKNFRRAYLVNEKAFDSQGRRALESDEDGRVIPVGGNVPLDQAIIPLPGQQPNPQLYQDSQVIESDITSVTGINDYQRGSLPAIRRTATEASIVQDAANSRAAEKLSKVESFISEVARRLVMLMQQYQSGDRVARYVGPNGAAQWIQYPADWIQGEFDFEVEAGSTQPHNDTARRQNATQLLQALAPFAVPGGPVNAAALVEYVLKYGFKVPDPTKFLSAPQSPLGQPQPPGPPGMPPGTPGQPPGQPPQAGPPPSMSDGSQQSMGGPIPDAHSGGGVPPEIAAQLASQVGLTLGGQHQ